MGDRTVSCALNTTLGVWLCGLVRCTLVVVVLHWTNLPVWRGVHRLPRRLAYREFEPGYAPYSRSESVELNPQSRRSIQRSASSGDCAHTLIVTGTASMPATLQPVTAWILQRFVGVDVMARRT